MLVFLKASSSKSKITYCSKLLTKSQYLIRFGFTITCTYCPSYFQNCLRSYFCIYQVFLWWFWDTLTAWSNKHHRIWLTIQLCLIRQGPPIHLTMQSKMFNIIGSCNQMKTQGLLLTQHKNKIVLSSSLDFMMWPINNFLRIVSHQTLLYRKFSNSMYILYLLLWIVGPQGMGQKLLTALPRGNGADIAKATESFYKGGVVALHHKH